MLIFFYVVPPQLLLLLSEKLFSPHVVRLSVRPSVTSVDCAQVVNLGNCIARDSPNSGGTSIISGTEFKFCTHIHRVDRNKSL